MIRLLLTVPLLTALTASAEINFRTQILPVLGKACAECHKAPQKDSSGKVQNPKGGFRMDAPSHMLKGGSSGPGVEPGDPDKSLVFQRILLPPEHEDAMPPKGKGKPLTFPEIELIKNWIAEGASFGEWKGSDANATTTTVAGPAKKTADPLAAGLTAPPADALKKLSDLGAVAGPVATDSKLVRVEWVANAASVTDKEIELLKPLAANITELDLSHTKITDAAMAVIGTFPRLTKLSINGTAVSDTGIASLKGLVNLDFLSAHSTQVSDAALATLQSLRKLKNVYFWKSRVSASGASSLQKALPGSAVTID
jgi:hypothetical protein